MTKITQNIFKDNPNWEESKSPLLPGVVEYMTDTTYIQQFYPKWDKHVTVKFGVDNLTGGKGVTIHVDNCDMDTIARFDVDTLEQANICLLPYGIRIGSNCNVAWDPTWAGDLVIAEFSLLIVKRLAMSTQAYPPGITWKEWRRILCQIIFALDQVAHEDAMMDAYDWYFKKFSNRDEFWPKWEAYHDRVMNGLKLFGEYFMHLNW